MFPLLVGALMILPQAEPKAGGARPVPKTLVGEVVIQDWNILIPHVPGSVEQAHAEYGKVGPQIQRGLVDLEKELVQLMNSDRYREGLPTAMRATAQEADAVKFLAKMMNDTDYARLRKETVRAWNEWQGLLVASGSTAKADPRTGAVKDAPLASTPSLTPEAQFRLKRRLAQEQAFKESALKDEAAYNLEVATPLGGSADMAAFARLQANTVQVVTNLQQDRQVKFITNQKSPAMAEAWQPMAEYLNACAVRLVDLDATNTGKESEDLLRLKFQAKVAFLERCRASLWFSQRIWTRMTSNRDPEPLRPLLKTGSAKGQPLPAVTQAVPKT